MTPLEEFGWNDFHRHQFASIKDNSCLPGRVVSIQGFKYYLATANGELETELSGKLLYGADPDEIPRVGDWVSYLDYGPTGYVISGLPRANALSRKNPGNVTERQILCANVDFALIVQGLDRDFNLMRLERYMAQVTACGITPVVVLNKSDLVTDPDNYLQKILALRRECLVFFCSTVNGSGLKELSEGLVPGKTYIMVGSSGVGKSSLLNVLLGADIQSVNSVSTFNNKGKHTTTRRDLFRLPNGSLIIDSPGMREFGFTSEGDQDADTLFPAIDELASSCRYADCLHISEPGCEVLQALASGELNPVTYESYVKMLKEQQRFNIRIEDKKKLNRQFGKMTKEAKTHRRKHKY
jgi:ribosome biogenesis GTPase